MEIQPDKVHVSEQAITYGVSSLIEANDRINGCAKNLMDMKDSCATVIEGDIKGSFYRAMKSIDDEIDITTSTLQELEDILREYLGTTKAIDNMAYIGAGGEFVEQMQM